MGLGAGCSGSKKRAKGYRLFDISYFVSDESRQAVLAQFQQRFPGSAFYWHQYPSCKSLVVSGKGTQTVKEWWLREVDAQDLYRQIEAIEQYAREAYEKDRLTI